ncbi:MAG: hypothetical protein WKF75_11235 [Singulisphaera sp.]
MSALTMPRAIRTAGVPLPPDNPSARQTIQARAIIAPESIASTAMPDHDDRPRPGNSPTRAKSSGSTIKVVSLMILPARSAPHRDSQWPNPANMSV